MRSSHMATVLVVDDQAETRKALTALLRREGYKILTAADAYAAMDVAAATAGRSLARAVERRRTRDRQAPRPDAPPPGAAEGSAP